MIIYEKQRHRYYYYNKRTQYIKPLRTIKRIPLKNTLITYKPIQTRKRKWRIN